MFELKKPLSLSKKKAILKMQRYKRRSLHQVRLRPIITKEKSKSLVT